MILRRFIFFFNFYKYRLTSKVIYGINILLQDKIVDMERWSSWFMAPVLKIGVGVSLPWVRIPPSPPFFYIM